MGRKITIPIEAERQIATLGSRLRLARLRRSLSAAQLAEKAGINRDTLSALELGRSSATLGAMVTVLWTLGLEKSLEALADSDADSHGKALEAARRPTRARRKPASKDEYDF